MTTIRTANGRAIALVTLLGMAMVTATYLSGALAVVSAFIIDELGVSRSQLGIAFGVYSLTGAAASPLLGSLTDRSTIGVIAGLFTMGAVGIIVAAAAPNYLILVLASMLGGLALGAGNPVTNRVISERISEARRGLVVGLKQSGPPLGLLAAGVILPPVAVAYGWRVALAVTAVFPMIGLAATRSILADTVVTDTAEPGGNDGVDAKTVVLWLAVIGFGVAMGVSAVLAFIPLYAQEEVGMTPTAAGFLAATLGLVGVGSRILWGAFGDRFQRPSSSLLIMAAVSVVAAVAIGAATWAGQAILWIGTIAAGASMLAWHAVAWLVIINRVGTRGVGKASGVMQAANSVGFAAGPPLAGFLVDLTDSYVATWSFVAALFVVVTVMTIWARRSFAARQRQLAESA